MIRITVEMVPMGDEKRAFIMAEGRIYNDGRGSTARGNYNAVISKVSHFRALNGGGWWKQGKITGFLRTRLGVWDLLYRALRELVGERNP